MLVNVLIILCCVIVAVSGVWIYNLTQDVKFYSDKIDEYVKNDNSFVIIKYTIDKKTRCPITREEEMEIKPNSIITIVPQKQIAELVEIYIRRGK